MTLFMKTQEKPFGLQVSSMQATESNSEISYFLTKEKTMSKDRQKM